MFKSFRCLRKGHLFVDSKSVPGTEVCVRCRYRKPFDGLDAAASKGRDGTEPRRWAAGT